jgi:hypothetical protein
MRAKSRAADHFQSQNLSSSLEKITEYLCGKFEKFGADKERLRSHSQTWACLNHLNYTLNARSIRLLPKRVLCLCPHYGGEGCLRFSIKKYETKQDTLCTHCMKEVTKHRQKARQKRINTEAGLNHAHPSKARRLSVPFETAR